MLTKAQAWQHSSRGQVVEVQSMAERVCKDWTGKFIPRAQIMQIQPAALVAKELGWASRIFTPQPLSLRTLKSLKHAFETFEDTNQTPIA
jgi:hypothetical protein